MKCFTIKLTAITFILLLLTAITVGANQGTGYQLRRSTFASGQVVTTGSYWVGSSTSSFTTVSLNDPVSARNGYWIADQNGPHPPTNNDHTLYLPIVTK